MIIFTYDHHDHDICTLLSIHEIFDMRGIPKAWSHFYLDSKQVLIIYYKDKIRRFMNKFSKIGFYLQLSPNNLMQYVLTYLRVSEANEVPISSHIWVASLAFRKL